MKISIYLCIIFLFVFGCKPAKTKQVEKKKKQDKIAVTIHKLKYHKWTETFKTFGVIEAADKIHISTDFSAQVKHVHIKEGQKVQQGDILITFDSKKRKLELIQAEMLTQNANSYLKNMEKQLKRKRKLYQKGMLSRENLDEVKMSYDQASSRAKETLAGELLARQKLKDMVLKSPVRGRLEKPKIKTGETVLPGSILLTIQTLNIVRVITYVNEKRINHIRLGAKAKVFIPGAKAKIFTGRIETIGLEADPKTGNFPVKIAIPNENGLLRPGMMAKVILSGLSWQKAIVIPEKSIQDRNLKRVVYIEENGKAKEIEPVLGMPWKGYIPVISGLRIGDKLIIEGVEVVKEGTPITVEKRGEK